MRRKILQKLLLVPVIFLSTAASAGLVTQHTSINTYQRSCPGLQDPNYGNKWGAIIELYYGSAPGQMTTEMMCHFNGGPQTRIYNNDGSVKVNSPYPNMPQAPAFLPTEAGGVIITQSDGTTQATIGAPNNKFYGDVILDSNNLGLPQFKVKSESNLLERNSINGFAATEYLWTGASQILTFTVNFDFYTSGGNWHMAGGLSNHDYLFALNFGAATDMILSPGNTFPDDWGNPIVSDDFLSRDEPLIVSSPSSPYTGTLSVDFNVEQGDKFFLYGWVQAFGFNGGYTDASHTVTSELSVAGKTLDDSTAILAQALQAAPPSPPIGQIPEPSSFLLMLLGLTGLFRWKTAK